MVVLAAVALGAGLYFMRPVLVPLVLAVFMTYLLSPLVDWVQLRLKVPRWVAVISGFVIAAGASALIVAMLWSSASGLAAKADLYQDKLVQMGGQLLEFGQSVGLPLDGDTLKQHLSELPVGTLLTGALGSVVDTASTFFLVLIFVIYLVAGRNPRKASDGIMKEIDSRIRRYIGVKVLLSAATGALTGIFLAAIGLDLAAVFGVLAFLLNFVPGAGLILSILLPIPVAIVQFDSTAAIVAVVAVPTAIQVVLGNVLEPRMLGSSLDLHPVTILLSLIFWGMLWGMAGMVLAAPITAVLKIVLDRVDALKPFGDLLAGRLSANAGKT